MRLPHHHQCHCTVPSASNSKNERNSTTYTQSDYFIIKLFHCTASQPTDFHQIRHTIYVFRRKCRNDFYHPEKKRHSTRDIQITCLWVEHAAGSNRSSIIKTLFWHENLKAEKKRRRKNCWTFSCFSLHKKLLLRRWKWNKSMKMYIGCATCCSSGAKIVIQGERSW